MSFPSFVDTIPRPLAWQQLPSFSLSVCGTTPWQGGGPARTAYQPYGMLRVRSTRFSRTLGSLLSPPLCSRTLFSRTILVKSVRVSRPPANLPPTHPSRVFTSSSLLRVYPRVSPVCFPRVYVFSVRRPLSEPVTFLVAVSRKRKNETRRRSPFKEIRFLVSSWKSKRSQQYGDSHVRGVFRGKSP